MRRGVARTRFILGLCLLMTADVAWSCISLFTAWMMKEHAYSKPFFVVYCSFSTLTVYLLGFLCCETWRNRRPRRKRSGGSKPAGEENEETSDVDDEAVNMGNTTGSDESADWGTVEVTEGDDYGFITGPPPLYQMSDSEFEPLKRGSSSSDSEKSGSHEQLAPRPTRVRFASVKEVRMLPHEEADEAEDSRRSSEMSHLLLQRMLRRQKKLTVRQVMLLALILSFAWVPAEYLLLLASSKTYVWTVQVFGSGAGVWALFFTAIFPSSVNDYLTVTKCVMVATCVSGGVLIGLSVRSEKNGGLLATESEVKSSSVLPWGVVTVFSSVLLAVFIVVLKKRSNSLFQIDVTMLLGFMGLWCLTFAWPVLVVFHYINQEDFELPPEKYVWLWLITVAIVGKVFASLLWIWGSFLTSPLMAVLALLLVSPFTSSWKHVLGNGVVDWQWMFPGCVVLIGSFTGVCLLHYLKNPDPVMKFLKMVSLKCSSLMQVSSVNSGQVNETTRLLSGSDEE